MRHKSLGFTRPTLIFLAVTACVLILAGCSLYSPLPLDKSSALKTQVSELKYSGKVLPPNPGIDEVTLLALENNPDLIVARNQKHIAKAQMIAAGILPNPSASGAYGFLLGGPGFVASLTAGFTQDIKSLIVFSVKQDIAEKNSQQIDAGLLWQEWQLVGKVRLLFVDITEENKMLNLMEQTASLLEERLKHNQAALAQGNSTLLALAPDIAAVSDINRQISDMEKQHLAHTQEMNNLLGLASDATPAFNDTLALPEINKSQINALTEHMADRRPDLVALQLGYEAQEKRVFSAILGQFPALVIGVSGGNDTSDVRTLGPQVTMDLPLFDRNQGSIAIERATRKQLHDEFALRLAMAKDEITRILAEEARLLRQAQKTHTRLTEMNGIGRNIEKAFKAGNVDEKTYVDTEVSLLARREESIALEQSMLEQEVAVATLTGAGMPRITLPGKETKP